MQYLARSFTAVDVGTRVYVSSANLPVDSGYLVGGSILLCSVYICNISAVYVVEQPQGYQSTPVHSAIFGGDIQITDTVYHGIRGIGVLATDTHAANSQTTNETITFRTAVSFWGQTT